jgi:hypothetical protein
MPIACSFARPGFLPAATAHQVAGLYADSPQPQVQADWTFCLQVLSSPAALAMNFLKKF